MIIDEYGRAYTNDRKEAYKYMVKNANAKFLPEGAYAFVHLFSKKGKEPYILPACLGQQHCINNKKIIINAEIVGLRGRQEEFVERLKELHTNGSKTLLCLSDTATGKSYAMFGAISYFKKTTCIVSPNKSIVEGLLEKFGGLCDMKAMTADQVRKADSLPDVLIITSASLNKVYDIINEYYSILLLDEIHNCPAKRVEQINKWKGEFICGLTATPFRKEFGPEGFKMLFKNGFKSGAKSLKEKVVTYEYEYDYSNKELYTASSKLAPGHPEVYRRLFINNINRSLELLSIIRDIEKKGIKKIMVFIDRKDHLKVLKEVLATYNIIEMSGDVDIKKAIVKTKNLDSYIILGIIGCVKEGLDITDLELGIMFVSTSRINTIVQAMGRMKRTDGKKSEALFIDFVDSVRFNGSKKKKLGYYSRRKVYKDLGYEIVKYKDFLSDKK